MLTKSFISYNQKEYILSNANFAKNTSHFHQVQNHLNLSQFIIHTIKKDNFRCPLKFKKQN